MIDMSVFWPLWLLAIVFIAGGWAWQCNNRTLADRRDALNRIRQLIGSGTGRFGPTMEAFNAVSYDSHLIVLVFFRDPWKLYSPELQSLVHSLPWATPRRTTPPIDVIDHDERS